LVSGARREERQGERRRRRTWDLGADGAAGGDRATPKNDLPRAGPDVGRPPAGPPLCRRKTRFRNSGGRGGRRCASHHVPYEDPCMDAPCGVGPTPRLHGHCQTSFRLPSGGRGTHWPDPRPISLSVARLPASTGSSTLRDTDIWTPSWDGPTNQWASGGAGHGPRQSLVL
jgi:hypothetical protein